ncbi:MAG TPA: hypothetical protein PKE30_05865 [Niabella sp.]|nr:hypothetical protein [Niabella sp.]
MVSLDSSSIILRDLYQSLISHLRTVNIDSVDGAFTAWICNGLQNQYTGELPTAFVLTNYQDVAKLAFLSEVFPHEYAIHNNNLSDGLVRLAGRSTTFLDGEPPPFRNDAIALLGIALGAKRIDGQVKVEISKWLASLIKPLNESLPNWKKLFLLVALGVSGESIDDRQLNSLLKVSDIRLALEAKGIDFLGSVDLDSAYQDAVSQSITDETESVKVACRASAIYYLTHRLPAISLSKPSLEQLQTILGNIPLGFKRWPWEDKPKTSTGTAQKWDVQNEYHVQSLIYFLLSPIFPDIEHEFYFEPVGQKNPRADIGLPSINLIIEIKFLRKNHSFGKMVEEVAADASLYFKRDSVFAKKYSKLLVFLWDDSARTQEHHEFKKGVLQLQNIVGCIVVSRPGNM